MSRISLGRVELDEGSMRGFPRAGRSGILLARVDGRYRALDDWCNHAGAALSGGRLEGGAVVCPHHRMAFDLATGRLASTPRLCDDQPAYPVEVVDGEVWVELPPPLVHRVLAPRPLGAHPPLLLLLHGMGRDETDLLGVEDWLDPRLLVAAARGPRRAGAGGYAWYDVDGRDDPPRKDPAQVLESRDLVIALLEELVGEHGADPARAFLLGFSQGAILALAVALARPDLVRGVVAHSARLLPEALPEPAPPALPRLEVLLLHGGADQLIRPERGREALARLAPLLGDRVTMSEWAGLGHALSPESLAAAGRWLAGRL